MNNLNQIKGYAYISNIEIELRSIVAKLYHSKYGINFMAKIMPDILESIKEKIEMENKDINSILTFEELLEYSNFPHLEKLLCKKEIFDLTKDYFGDLSKQEFISCMFKLYLLRNKIAHPKKVFTSINLTELKEQITNIFNGKKGVSFVKELFLKELSSDIQIPENFFVGDLTNNNLPTPDYSLDGGFIQTKGGRKDFIDKIKKFILAKTSNTCIFTITGAGGVGKTAVALESIFQIIEEYPKEFNSVVWIQAKESSIASGEYQYFKDATKDYDTLINKIFEVISTEETGDSKSFEFKKFFIDELIKKNKYLFVIDNLETITDNRFLEFIKNIPYPNRVLITSRTGLGELERRIPLKELTKNESIILFRTVAREKGLLKLSNLPESTIEKYVKLVEYYPLAIKWSLGQISFGNNPEEVFSRIKNADSELTIFCLNDIFNIQSNNAKNILFALSLFDEEETTIGKLIHITNLNMELVSKEIKNLNRSSLIISKHHELNDEIETIYEILPLTKDYLLDKLKNEKGLKEEFKKRKSEIDIKTKHAISAKIEHQHSLAHAGANTDDEKIALIKSQTAWNIFQNGDYLGACELMDEAIKITPKFTPILRNYAVIQSEEKHIQKADELMGLATSYEPKNAHLWYVWGNINKKSGRFEVAYKYYSKALKLTSKDPLMNSSYAICQRFRRFFEDAEKHFKIALDLRKNGKRHNLINLQGLSETYLRWSSKLFFEKEYISALDKINLANETINKALKIDNRDLKLKEIKREILLYLAIQIAEEKGIKESLQYFEESLKPMQLGQITLKKRYKDKIHEGTVFYNLAKYYSRENNVGESEKYKDKAVKLLKNDSKMLKKIKELGMRSTDKSISGIIKHFNWDKKFGFIKSKNIDYFFHISNFNIFVNQESLRDLKDKKVKFNPSKDDDDRNIATEIIFE